MSLDLLIFFGLGIIIFIMGVGNSIYEIVLGFIFHSFWKGILIVIVIKTIGYCIAFILGRFLFKTMF